MKTRFLNWLHVLIFGPIDIEAEIITSEANILVTRLVMHTRFGDYTFPAMIKELPIPLPGQGYYADGEIE